MVLVKVERGLESVPGLRKTDLVELYFYLVWFWSKNAPGNSRGDTGIETP